MASEKITNILEEIKTLSVMELFDLEKAIEDEFGVSAASVAVAAPAGGAAAAAEEQTEFTVMLKSFGDSKMGVIKAVKDALGMGLKDAKELVEKAPVALKENVSKDEADELMKKLDGCGGELEIK
ncbi:MAG: 50S ribosomal protein L7/L12 [Saccharofermentans sp.]|jgi:large subunit ribosomal protein L7/L12|nr:50S ribosomal protein L7/L12 [Mageeibacillus sp.]MCI1264390.1 50S ribosomal protein L7/L12 [Saccharofermentans sp.]MCI1275816.1 50S ribosomal protein L7/L12 [Saccharofermentans sp.]MCI1769540.1 50S ribosomal protein L7/L12 [Mageeibacillus sp.]MCI2044371.1 50S ribosomal protein L7/L12 [Mageeibacillus sp.]